MYQLSLISLSSIPLVLMNFPSLGTKLYLLDFLNWMPSTFFYKNKLILVHIQKFFNKTSHTIQHILAVGILQAQKPELRDSEMSQCLDIFSLLPMFSFASVINLKSQISQSSRCLSWIYRVNS